MNNESGRFTVFSQRTGKTYVVEPTGDVQTGWGNINPTTGKVEVGQGAKSRGSIDRDESVITEQNGFVNITTLPVGHSPFSYIEKLDASYPDKIV